MTTTPYQSIKGKIESAKIKANRASDNITLVAVSKTKPANAIHDLVQLGHLDFGENYVQEFLQKKAELPNLIRWHFIGHLQSRKVKDIVGNCSLIHSIDSIDLAQEIQKRAQQKNIIQKILLQVDLGKEATKSGFDSSQLLEAAKQISQLSHVKLAGLMTLPPFFENPEMTRPFFRELKHWLLNINQDGAIQPLTELSMGMSHDFHIAIEEGATLIRIGTALFGQRNKN